MWLNTSKEALAAALNKEANLYPASTTVPTSRADRGAPFYGNQKIYEEFANRAKDIQPFTGVDD